MVTDTTGKGLAFIHKLEVRFKTNHSDYITMTAPAPPNQPYVTEYNENGHYYKVTLYNTSTLNGPIK